LGFVQAVLAGKEAVDGNEALACAKFYKELSIMRSLVDESRAMVHAVEAKTHRATIKFRSELNLEPPTPSGALKVE
jgi:hypothetical protein